MMKTYLEIFINTLESQNTKHSYKTSIQQMLNHVNKSEEKICQVDLTNYKSELKKYAEATQENRIRSLNKFIDFLKENKINENLSHLKGVNVDIDFQDRDSLTMDECLEVIKVADIETKAILYLALQTSSRIGAISEITLKDYLSEEDIVIVDKGKKKNTLRLSEVTREYINCYTKLRLNTRKTDKLFLTTQGNPITSKSINTKIKKYIKMIGITDRNITIHSFRRTSISKFNDSYGIYKAKVFANHSNLSSTLRYIKVDKEESLNIMEGFM